MIKGRLYVLLASSSIATLLALCLLRRRARKRAKRVADRAVRDVVDGILIDANDAVLRERILQSAMKRASKWISFQVEKVPVAMVGQVGGHGRNKAPILSLEPDYVLKPLYEKENRGLREVAFYESVELASHNHHCTVLQDAEALFENSVNAVTSSSPPPSRLLEWIDFIAMTLAILLRDPVVAESEATLLASWQAMREEIEVLRRLSLFTASYYGVVENIQQQSLPQLVVSNQLPIIQPQYHILLQDLTSSFRRPCVMDLKIGTQSFEPDASLEKQEKERRKYGEYQSRFGIRLVGMLKYEPTHPDADPNGHVIWEKQYGRCLTSMEALIGAFSIFFRTAHDGQTTTATTSKVRLKVVASVLSLVRALSHRFKDNQCLAFYSSSLLIVYDAVDDTDHGNLHMVDFGHVRRQAGGDAGYRYGLQTLSSILLKLLEEEPSSGSASPLTDDDEYFATT